LYFIKLELQELEYIPKRGCKIGPVSRWL